MKRQRIWKTRVKKIKARSPFKKLTKANLLKFLALFSFLGTLFLFLLSVFLFVWYAKDLPRPDKIVRKEGFSTQIFDRNGVLLYDVFSDKQRTLVKLKEIPLYLRQATIAIEDKNFYLHQGFDPHGLLRAFFNIVVHHRLQGGSTLTQQLVKNVLLSPKRTISRKIKEFALAIQIEKKYSKDEILQMYLNEAPYGGTAWGVETAAETYFNKKVKDLNLIESAILAGLPQKPSYYSPFGVHPKAYINRTRNVLRRMREDGYISSNQEKKVQSELDKIRFTSSFHKLKAPHFVMYIKRILEEKYGQRLVEQGGLKIYTTLDWELQKKSQKIVAEEVSRVEKLHITNGAAMVLDTETGEILAMVGSKDYFAKDYDGQVNVTLAFRQPGSAIKPITYVTAFKKGFTPATLLTDVVTHFPGGTGPDYVPKDYDNKDHGPVQLRFSLGNSLNIPAVKLLAKIGVKSMLQTAFDLGLESLEPTQENMRRLGLSVTLGGGEVRLIDLISAYAAFANGGLKVKSQAILKVEDNKGRILEEYKPMKGKRVLTKEQAFLINDILADNKARLITFGSHSLLNISGRKIAVKTGTTDNMRDNWAIGWDPKYIVAAWVGNNDNSVMKKVASGVSGASPIWRRIILTKLKKEPIREFPVPNGIFSKEVDLISGFPSHDNFPSRQEFFIKGTEPAGEDPIHTKLKICRSDEGKLAPNTLVTKGEYNEKEFIVLKENDPLSSDGKNRWQEAIDAWIAKQNDVRYKYPHDYCEASDKIIVKIKNLENNSQINEFEFEVEAEVVSNKKIVKVEFYADDNLKDTLLEKPYKTKLILEKGLHKIKVIAKDEENNKAEKEITIGVKVNPLASPSPSPSIEPSPSPSPSPSPNPSISPSPSPLHS